MISPAAILPVPAASANYAAIPDSAAPSRDDTSSSQLQTPHQQSEEPTPIIAHTPSTSRPASFNASSRRPVCTHMRLTRIYGPFKCSHCGRVPRLGWVWRCVQDFGDDLVGFNRSDDEDFASLLERRLRQESRRQPPNVPNISRPHTAPVLSAAAGEHVSGCCSSDQPAVSPPALKPWVQKLADQDFYTPAQLNIIRNQRQRVLDYASTCSRAREPTRSELKDAAASDPTSLVSSLHQLRRARQPAPQAALFSRSCSLLPYWQTEERQDSTAIDAASSDQAFPPSQPRLAPTSPTPPTGTICIYQSCSSCRPSHRDRTWQCLASAHFYSSNGSFQVPDPATDNRPLSDPRLVLTACHKVLHPEPSPWDEAVRPSIEDDEFYDDDYGSGYDSSEISPDISSGASLEGTPTSSQFEENQGWDQPSFSSSRFLRPQATGFASAGRALRKASSMDPKLLRSSRDIEHMDLQALGVGIQGNADMASGIALQAHEDSNRPVSGEEPAMRPGAESALASRSGEEAFPTSRQVERKTSAEVIVEGGAAVTEEAVVAGAPDIIMQT